MTRAAIYARYSSDRQNERSIDGQVALCREWLAREGIEVAEVLADYAISAASLDRPAMDRLRALARGAELGLVVTESIDRLSRREADTHALLDDLAFHGVRVVGVSDGIDTAREGSEMLVGMRAIYGAAYLRDLGKKTRRGMRDRVTAGMAACAVPFGYVTSEATNGRAIAIDEPAAAIVRRLFAEYLAGQSPAAIASRLNAEAIPPPRSSRRDRYVPASWQASTVRAMLSNETYAGVWIWGRREWRKVPGRQRRVARERPAHEWIRDERPALALVDRATWDRANVRTAPAAERKGGGKRSFLLSGLLRCGVCGALMAIHGGGADGRRYYRCSRASSRGTCENRLSMREADARETFLRALRDTLLERRQIASVLDAVAEALREWCAGAGDELATRRARLGRAEAAIRRLVNAIAEGASEALAAKVRELEQEARAERIAIAALEDAPSADDLPSVDEALEAVRELVDLIGTGDVHAGRETLRGCLDGGAIRAAPTGGRYFLEAGVLPPMVLGGARSELRIAGAGFAHVRVREEVRHAG